MTLFQLKLTFQSHALRNNFFFVEVFKSILQFYLNIVRQQKTKLARQNALTKVKYTYDKKKITYFRF